MKEINCRTDKDYNQKYLDYPDSEWLKGFDWAVEQSVDNFFDNGMAGLADEDRYIGHILCEKLPKDMQEEYVMTFTFDREDEERKCETYADLIRMEILEWLETARNELIVSMLDNYGEDKYDEIKAKVDGQSKAAS